MAESLLVRKGGGGGDLETGVNIVGEQTITLNANSGNIVKGDLLRTKTVFGTTTSEVVVNNSVGNVTTQLVKCLGSLWLVAAELDVSTNAVKMYKLNETTNEFDLITQLSLTGGRVFHKINVFVFGKYIAIAGSFRASSNITLAMLRYDTILNTTIENFNTNTFQLAGYNVYPTVTMKVLEPVENSQIFFAHINPNLTNPVQTRRWTPITNAIADVSTSLFNVSARGEVFMPFVFTLGNLSGNDEIGLKNMCRGAQSNSWVFTSWSTTGPAKQRLGETSTNQRLSTNSTQSTILFGKNNSMVVGISPNGSSSDRVPTHFEVDCNNLSSDFNQMTHQTSTVNSDATAYLGQEIYNGYHITAAASGTEIQNLIIRKKGVFEATTGSAQLLSLLRFQVNLSDNYTSGQFNAGSYSNIFTRLIGIKYFKDKIYISLASNTGSSPLRVFTIPATTTWLKYTDAYAIDDEPNRAIALENGTSNQNIKVLNITEVIPEVYNF